MIGETLVHYRITAQLGEGGMGEVHHATDTKLAARLLSRFCRRHRAGRWAHYQKQSTWPWSRHVGLVPLRAGDGVLKVEGLSSRVTGNTETILRLQNTFRIADHPLGGRAST